MLRYLQTRTESSTQQVAVAAGEEAIASKKRKRAEKGKRVPGPWVKYTAEAKEKVVAAYSTGGMPAVRLLASPAPPSATIRGWRQQLTFAGTLKPPGRPTQLTSSEEQLVLRAFKALRQGGAVVDTEVLSIVADTTAREKELRFPSWDDIG